MKFSKVWKSTNTLFQDYSIYTGRQRIIFETDEVLLCSWDEVLFDEQIELFLESFNIIFLQRTTITESLFFQHTSSEKLLNMEPHRKVDIQLL